MSDSKIQFNCHACGKSLSISSEFAGRSARCPGCEQVLAVPTMSAGTVPVLSPISSDLPSSSFPSLPSNSATSGLGDKTAPYPAPNDWAAQSNFNKPPSPALPSKSTNAPSAGAAIGGFMVACIVGLICSVLWIVITVATQRELGIVAWGIGGLIGLIGGAIARNPSPIYATTMAIIAVISIAFAKLILICGIMIMHAGANFVDSILSDSPERERDRHVLVDQMLANNDWDATKKKKGAEFNSGYFGDEDELQENALKVEDGEIPNKEEITNAVRWSAEHLEFQNELDRLLDKLSDEEKAAQLQHAKDRHPNWIEDNHDYLAMVVQMLDEPDFLDENLKAHAQYEVKKNAGDVLDPAPGENYEDSVSPKEFAVRRKKLHELAATRLKSLTPEQRDQAINNAMAKLSDYQPYPDAFVAMLDAMVVANEIPEALKAHAKARLNFELKSSFEYLEGMAEDAHMKKDRELQALVNQKLATQSKVQREALIAASQARHPEWERNDPKAIFAKFEAGRRQLPGDGTFWGSFHQVVGIIDALWLFLGASSAYGASLRQGHRKVA